MDNNTITNGGVNEQGVAAPAENVPVETGNEGARGQEIAEPAATETTGTEPKPSENAQVGEEGASGHPGTEEKPAQTPEQNAQYAAARRKAERDQAREIERIRTETAERENALIAGLGFVNPETGQTVRTRAEYDAMQKAVSRQREQQLARTAGMTEEEWTRLVESSPTVQAARQTQQRAEAAAQAARMEQVRTQMAEELGEITKLDANIKSFADLRGQENWPQIEERMKRGYTMLDAYRLVNMDAIAERRAAAAQQKALNATVQKQHMQSTEQQGTGGISVPKSVMEQYKRLNPGVSESEIAAHYAKYAKK